MNSKQALRILQDHPSFGPDSTIMEREDNPSIIGWYMFYVRTPTGTVFHVWVTDDGEVIIKAIKAETLFKP